MFSICFDLFINLVNFSTLADPDLRGMMRTWNANANIKHNVNVNLIDQSKSTSTVPIGLT